MGMRLSPLANSVLKTFLVVSRDKHCVAVVGLGFASQQPRSAAPS
jgi:hypothetical protein